MGFDRTQAEQALRASFYHVERAAEYLITVKLKITFCFFVFYFLFLYRVTFLILVKYQLQVKEVNQDKHRLVQKVQQGVDDRVERRIYRN